MSILNTPSPAVCNLKDNLPFAEFEIVSKKNEKKFEMFAKIKRHLIKVFLSLRVNTDSFENYHNLKNDKFTVLRKVFAKSFEL